MGVEVDSAMLLLPLLLLAGLVARHARLELRLPEAEEDRQRPVEGRRHQQGREVVERGRDGKLGAAQEFLDGDDRDQRGVLDEGDESLPTAGMTILKAWGKTMRRCVCQPLRPIAQAASFCPLGTAWMPARNTSVR